MNEFDQLKQYRTELGPAEQWDKNTRRRIRYRIEAITADWELITSSGIL